ncbi:FG-GAP repeat protein [Tautonia sociabilis]|uniref:Matrixin family metalloprotease n=1 Tax=Tautonia sociabilis TaxID=2080755 RepID=A0A432MG15_9BACT|nr:FG-GAP repeat protein [Tautonia sociabilis]RUL85270.1 hypothetical protein TsocGM_18850 [Tautonia sociabilis]
MTPDPWRRPRSAPRRRSRRSSPPGAEPLEAKALRATIAPADYDGDGKSDFAIFETDPATGAGVFSVDRSRLGRLEASFGGPDDGPIVGDFDGDGRDDIAVYGFSPLDGFSRFGILPSGGGSAYLRGFGGVDDLPVAADFDGDGTTDLAVFGYSPDNGVSRFAAILSGGPNAEFPAGVVTLPFGGPDDGPIVGDFDGDGRTDFGVYGPSGGDPFSRFLIRLSAGPSAEFPTGTIVVPFGGLGDVPAVGDFDGDGRDDIAVAGFSTQEQFRRFAILPSGGGPGQSIPFGGFDDRPVPLDLDGDRITDLAVFGYSPVEGHSRFAVVLSSTQGAIALPRGGPDAVGLPRAAVPAAAEPDPNPEPDPDPNPDPDPGRPPFRIEWVNRGTATDHFSAAERAVIDQAIDLWEGLILDNNRPDNTLRVTFEGGSFSGLDMGDTLGLSTVRFDAEGTIEATIRLDADGGGQGWYIDPTPADHAEFPIAAASTFLVGGPEGRYDFLSTVSHELGHALGLGIGFAENASDRLSPLPGGGGYVYTGPSGVQAVLSPGLDHLDPTVHAYDLLSPEGLIGTRALPSPLDLQLLADVYGYRVSLPPTPADSSPPEARSASLQGFSGSLAVVVDFNEGIDLVGANDPSRYTLLRPRGDSFEAVPSPFVSASFDVATLRLTLRLRSGLQPGPNWRVVLPGEGSTALTDPAGNPLDGDRDGLPGGDAVLPILA